MFDSPSEFAISYYHFWDDFVQPELAQRFTDDGDAVRDYLYCADSDDAGAIITRTAYVLYGPALPPLAGPDEPFTVDED